MSARRRTAGAAGARAGRARRRARRRGRARSSSRPRGPASVSEARLPATGFGPRRPRGRSPERPRAGRAAAPGPGGRASSRCRAARRSARTPRGRRASLAATVVPRRRGRGRGRPGRARARARASRRPSGCAMEVLAATLCNARRLVICCVWKALAAINHHVARPRRGTGALVLSLELLAILSEQLSHEVAPPHCKHACRTPSRRRPRDGCSLEPHGHAPPAGWRARRRRPCLGRAASFSRRRPRDPAGDDEDGRPLGEVRGRESRRRKLV